MQYLPIPSLSALSKTCRTLNNNPFLTSAIDAHIASSPEQVLTEAAHLNCSITMRRCLARTRQKLPMPCVFPLAYRGCDRALKIVLDCGTSPNMVDAYGTSVLGTAVWGGNVKATMVLLRAGAKVSGLTSYDDGFTLAEVARLAGNKELEELLVNFEEGVKIVDKVEA